MLLGPLFRFELVRLARRGTHLPLRVVLVALLFVGLLAAYLQLFPRTDVTDLLFGGSAAADPSQLDKFGETFLVAFLVIQQVAVLLLTPVYAGGAIAEEKEKGRLDFLLTAPLGRWEIVLGKLAARLVFVLAVIVVGLPVVAFTLLFGGVDPDRVLASFAVAGVTAVALASFSVMVSVLRPTLREVLLWVYFTLIASGLVGLLTTCVTPLHGAGGVLSPATILLPLLWTWAEPMPPTGDPTWTLVGVYALLHLPLALAFVGVAVAHVREAVVRSTVTPLSVPPPLELEPPPAPPSVPSDPPLPDWYKLPERPVFPAGYVPTAAEGRDFLVPPLGDREDPFDWKEWHFGAKLPLVEGRWFGCLRGCGVAVLLLLLGMGLFIGLVSSRSDGRGLIAAITVSAGVVLTVSVLVLPFAGLRAATGIAEERAKKTLDSLFALPHDRRVILWAKVRAAVQRSRWWVGGSGFAALAAALTGGLHLLFVPGMIAMFVGYGMFTVGLGAWLGVWCKTGVRAVLAHLVVTLVTLFGPLVIAPFVGSWTAFLSPPAAMGSGATLSLIEGDRWGTAHGWVVCATVPIGLMYAVVGLIAWGLAEKRFEAEGRE